MICAYTGLPGSGKSYRLVHELDSWKGWLCHNIKGLHADKLKGPVAARTHEEVASAFGVDVGRLWDVHVQEEVAAAVREQYGDVPILWVIDEAQGVWHGLKEKELHPWLSWHRHQGQTIYLATQNLRNLPRYVQRLVELEIRGKKGAVFPWFLYRHRAEGEAVGWSWKPKDKRIFALYKSFDSGDGRAAKRSLLLPGIAFVGVLAAGVAWSYQASLKERGIPPEERGRGVATGASASKLPEGSGRAPEQGQGAVNAPPPAPAVWTSGVYWVGVSRGRVLVSNGGVTYPLDEWFPGVEVVQVQARVVVVLCSYRGIGRIPKGGGMGEGGLVVAGLWFDDGSL